MNILICPYCKNEVYLIDDKTEISEYRTNKSIFSNKYKSWTKEEENTACRMRQEGSSWGKIAKILGRTKISISGRLNSLKRNLINPELVFPIPEIAKLRTNYSWDENAITILQNCINNNMKPKDIAKQMNRNVSSINNAIYRFKNKI